MTRISDAIKKDHKELRDYYQNIINASDEDTATRWGNQFTWELARHSVAEELIVYPALESNIDHGKSLADKDRQEHQKVKELLYNFQKMSAKDKEFRPAIDIIMQNLNKHIDEEEDEDLPSLESVLDQSESEAMAKKFDITKVLVPTRSHPSAPTQPFFESVVGLMTAPIDRIADIMRKFPEQ